MKKQILIIDDSKTQLSSLKLIFTKAGYDVITAADGAEGIKAVYENMPDLVVSDIIMPEINGYHLCRLLKNDKVLKDIPVVLLTVLDKKLDKFWGIRAGADGYFQKDGNYESLIKEIDALIEKNSDSHPKNKFNSVQKISCIVDYSEKVAQILDQSLIESTIMNEFRDLSEFVLDTKILNNRLFGLISSILDYNLAAVFYNDKDLKKDKIVFFNKNECNVREEVIEKLKSEFLNTLFPEPEVERRQGAEYQLSESGSSYKETIETELVFKSKTIIPIKHDGKIIGGLALYHRVSDKFNPSKLLSIIIEELKLIMRIKWLYSETRYLAITDALTGLYNRRYFQQILDREFSRSNRYGSPLSIAMIDIDNFKTLNDTYGHLFGDEVLSEISKMMSNSLRKTDYVARYGGEELVAVLPETKIEQALIPLERLRNLIESHSFVFDEKRINVTISLGLAQNNDHIASSDNFIQKADTALYQAKQRGKNRIELSVSTF